jgi:hypothetical protein
MLDDSHGDLAPGGIHHPEDAVEVASRMGDRQRTREIFILNVNYQ